MLESPVRSLSMDEFSRSTPDPGANATESASLILFINSRLTERERRELDDITGNRTPMRRRDLSASSAPFASISTIPTSSEVENDVVSRVQQIVGSRRRLSSRSCAQPALAHELVSRTFRSLLSLGSETTDALASSKERNSSPRSRRSGSTKTHGCVPSTRRLSVATDATCANPLADPSVSRIGPTHSWARIDPGATCSFVIERRPAANR